MMAERIGLENGEIKENARPAFCDNWTLAFFVIGSVEQFAKSLYITSGENEFHQTPDNQKKSTSRWHTIDHFQKVSWSKIAIIFLTVILAITLLRESWIHEDSFITLRTVRNFVEGQGLRWNLADRVQVYTHPLWMLLLSAGSFVTKEYFFTAHVVSLSVAFVAVLVLLKFASSAKSTIFALLILLSSRAFIDYSVSGLENPLTSLLLILFCTTYLTRETSASKTFCLTFIAALAGVNRLDTLLFFLPPLIFYLLEQRNYQTFFYAALGSLPLIGWLGFSLFYYGFLFPNSAYAKLYTSVHTADLIGQGLLYFRDLLWHDPLTFLVIFSGLLVTIFSRRRKEILIVIGLILYLFYIVQIGGDYMRGRFFTGPLFLAVILWVRSGWLNSLGNRRYLLLCGFVLILGLFASHPVLVPFEYERRHQSEFGITDERLFYEDYSGLFQNIADDPPLSRHWLAVPGIRAKESGQSYMRKGGIGLAGFFAGSDVHIVDTLGLAEPLLARLPVANPFYWRIGHFKRFFPEGLEESLQTGENLIADPELGAYYDVLLLITRGPLLDKARLMAIWRINTDQYDHLLDREAYLNQMLVKITLDDVNGNFVDNAWVNPEGMPIPYQGMKIDLQVEQMATRIEISVDTNYDYRVEYLLNGNVVGFQELIKPQHDSFLYIHQATIPENASKHGFDTIHLLPIYFGVDPKLPRGLGHLVLYTDN